MPIKSLPVKLEIDELVIRGHELADKCAELADIELRKKCANNAFKEEIEKRLRLSNRGSPTFRASSRTRPNTGMWRQKKFATKSG